ncbi:hypothetical protein ARZXY2_2530 [Arthrobacter sp. ZXY-2]|nr:hypothetical protein ARZXY2_2530 [Arthrobacter sp. ZXY-2]
MTEQTTEDTKPKRFADEHEAKLLQRREENAGKSWHEVDGKLAMLLAVQFGPLNADKGGAFDLTVTIDGATITGLAVSEATWEEALRAEVKAASEEAAEKLGGRLDQHQEQLEQYYKDVQENPLLLRQVRFVHFLKPTVISGSITVEAKPTRVALSKVSSWFLGTLKV